MSEEVGGWNPEIQGLFPGRGWIVNKMLPPSETASQLSGKNSCMASLQRGETSVCGSEGQHVTANGNSQADFLQGDGPGSKAHPASWLCELGQVTSRLPSLSGVTL